jgi:hypothetical protein
VEKEATEEMEQLLELVELEVPPMVLLGILVKSSKIIEKQYSNPTPSTLIKTVNMLTANLFCHKLLFNENP